MPEFELHPNLAADTFPVAELSLCTVRLMRDANYSWLLLVPRIAYTTEIVDLTPEHRAALMDDIVKAGVTLREACPCDKLNIATLGNAVSQIHVHVIARLHNDVSWPKPVWNAAPVKTYAAGAGEALAAKLAARLK